MVKKHYWTRLSIKKVLLRSLILAIFPTVFLMAFLIHREDTDQNGEYSNPFSSLPYSLQKSFYVMNLRIEELYCTFFPVRTDNDRSLAQQMTTEKLYFSVSIRSSVDATSQIFYDIGNGLNEADSVRLTIKAGHDFSMLRFPLPSNPLRYIRFDPIDRAGYFSLKEVKIVNQFDELIYRPNKEAIHPLRQIKQMSVRDEIFSIETHPDANDPILFIFLDFTLDYKSILFTSVIYWCMSFSTIFLALSGGISLYFHLSRLIKYIRDSLTRRDRVINVVILVISSTLSIVIGYCIYTYVRPTPLTEPVVYRGEENDYALAYYSTQGQRLTDVDGGLKLVTDPFTIFANYPQQRTKSFSIDIHGLRDGGEACEKSAQLLAIVLGGSAAFGYGLDNDSKTFPSLLNCYNQDYHIINSGVAGFLSGQELAQMVHYLDDLHPALYIVFDGWNDIYDPYQHAHARKWPVRGGPIGFNNTFLALETRLLAYAQMQSKEQNPPELLPAGELLNESEYFRKIRKTYLSNISKMNAFARARDAELLMVFQPELGNKKSKTREEQEILKIWDTHNRYENVPVKFRELISEAKKFCTEQNIPFIDINAEPEFSKNSKTLFFDAVHPNELGHEIIAKIINKRLSEK